MPDLGYKFSLNLKRFYFVLFFLNINVALQKIQRHGAWRSDCVSRYTTETNDVGEQVINMFMAKVPST